MKTHTSVGAEILKGSNSPFLQMAVDIAQYHHERWDGKGYPNGLKGEEIPLTARIMNICDQYDALRSNDPTSRPMTMRRAAQSSCRAATEPRRNILTRRCWRLSENVAPGLPKFTMN